jgi:creatinine amidohydrolase
MRFEEMNWREIEAIDKDTILFLTLGPMEVHGPHLPVGTDIFIAKHVETKALEALKEKKICAVALPPLPIGTCKMAEDFIGSISINWKVMRNLLRQMFHALSSMNFKYIILCNFHMDLHHIKAIYTAISKSKKEGLMVCDPLSSLHYRGLLWPSSIDEKEVHADMKETSVALCLFPHLTKQWEKLLPVKIKMDGPEVLFKTMKEMGAKEGYVGSPSLATKEYGEESLQRMVNIMVETAEKMKSGDALPELPSRIKIILRLIK